MSSEENIVEFEVLDGAKTAGGMDAAGETDVTDSDVQLQAEQLDEADVQESQPEDVEPQAEQAEQPQPGPEGTPLNSLRGVLGNKTLEDVIEREAKEEQDTSSPFSLSRTLGGVIISRFVKRQMGVVLLISVFILIYISLRYMCQKKLVEIDRTETKIVDARYKATVCTSKLTEASRESNVLKRLAECGDSTLSIADEPPYLIKIEEED
ncbi:MAG: hypothetical protein IJ145_05790 [Prevotella sp.]|nr:hypothetical protein [Prevotella sp.]